MLSNGTLSNTGKGHHNGPLSFIGTNARFQLSQLSRKWAPLLGMPTLIHFVLKYIQIVCGSYSNDIFLGVPGRMKDFLVEV